MSNQIAQWLVNAKVSPPKQLVHVCRRVALLEQVNRSEHPVVWIEAASGFGKTLFLSQWRTELLQRHQYVGWVSVDTLDDPDILLPYMAYSLHCAGLDMQSTGLLSSSYHDSDLTYSLGRLLHRIEANGKPVALMLDDCENASAAVVSQVFEPLLRMQSDNLRIAFACRRNPGLSLSNLVVQGRLLTLGATQLSFNTEEITEFFAGLLERNRLRSVRELTGGWPVALQLMRSFGADISALNPSQLFHNKAVTDYFREQLMNKLPGDERAFLLAVSILDTVSADCADYVRDATDSKDMLQKLNYLGGILGPLEDSDESWRIHPLVREFFLHELQTGHRDTFLSLSEKYAAWLARAGRSIDAVRVALMAQKVELAVGIFIESGGLQLFLREGMQRLRKMVDLFDGLELHQYPRIQLARSLIFTKNGQIRKANEAFSFALEHSPPMDELRDKTAFLIDRFIVEICLIEYGCTPAANALSKSSLQYIMENTRHDPAIYGCIGSMQCLLYLQSAAFARCFGAGLEAITTLTNCGQLFGLTHIHFHLGMAELAMNRVNAAKSRYAEAQQILHEHFPDDKDLLFVNNVVRGELFWELGDVNQAKKHMKHVVSHPKNIEAWFDIHMAVYQVGAQFILAESGLDAALRFLDQEEEKSDSEGLMRLSRYLRGVRFLILYEAGEAALARSRYPSADANDEALGRNTTWRETETLTLAQIRSARLREDWQTARALIDNLLDSAAATGNVRTSLYGMTQKVILARLTGNVDTALSMLIETLTNVGQSHYLRPFLQEQAQLDELLQQLAARETGAIDAEVVKLAGSLLAQFTGGAVGTTDRRDFSGREREVLTELAKGQPDKLISRTLGISVHGVRYHLKNIYLKLGADNRLQAVSAAQKLGVLEGTSKN